jgi:hypothetical protein
LQLIVWWWYWINCYHRYELKTPVLLAKNVFTNVPGWWCDICPLAFKSIRVLKNDFCASTFLSVFLCASYNSSERNERNLTFWPLFEDDCDVRHTKYSENVGNILRSTIQRVALPTLLITPPVTNSTNSRRECLVNLWRQHIPLGLWHRWNFQLKDYPLNSYSERGIDRYFVNFRQAALLGYEETNDDELENENLRGK